MSDVLLLEPTDWRDLPPVPEDEQVPVPTTPSQTFLRHHDRCDRAAYLYLKHKGGAGSHPLNRGALVHDAIAIATHELLALGERRPSPERAKDVLMEVMAANPHLQCSAQERDAARGMMHNWAMGSFFDPARIIAIEQTLTLVLGEWTIRGRVDLAQDLGPGTVEVVDYKTSWAMPTSEEFEGTTWREGEPEGWSGDFQTQVYALLMAFGRFEDGLGLGEGYERFRLCQRFPRHLRTEGLAERQAWVTRKQLVDFQFDLELQLQRLAEVNRDERRWQPTPGSHCTECPAAYECPLPRHLRPESQLADADESTLEKMAASWNFMQGRARALKARIKSRANELGLERVYIGRDLALEFRNAESSKRKTTQAELELAIESARMHGADDFDYRDHFTYTTSTEFKKRRVAPRKDNGNGG